MVSCPLYLQRRPSGIFYVRVAVPKACIPLLERREIKRSLATRIPSEAVVAAQQLSLELKDMFAECVRMGARTPNWDRRRKQQRAKEIAGGFFRTPKISINRRNPDGSEESIIIERDNPEEEAQIANSIRNASEQCYLPNPSLAPPRPEGELLSVVMAKFQEERIREQAWTAKTAEEYRVSMKLYLEILGDLGVNVVNNLDARLLKENLLKLPPNISKDRRYRNLSVKEILAIPHEKTIELHTVNKHFSRMSALFEWAARNGYTDRNPFEGMKLQIKKSAHEERQAFSDVDLGKLFSTDVHKINKWKHPHYYWLPLLGLYTGARLNELCQMRVSDVKKDGEIWCFDINEKDGKQLKNASSSRLVPIHPDLIRLGILDYHQTLTLQGKTQFFPELKPARDGYGHAPGKWFNERFRFQCGITEKGKTFHSFRHTVANQLKQKSVDQTQASALLGHATESITYSRYGKNYLPEVLLAVVSQLDFGLHFARFAWDRMTKA